MNVATQHSRTANVGAYSLWFALGVFLLALQLPAPAPVEAQAEAQQCEVSLNPDAVHVDEGNVVVEASVSEDPGPILEVLVDPQSGLEVDGWDQSADTEITLMLLTGAAEPGDWEVTITGEAALCVGEVTVEERR